MERSSTIPIYINKLAQNTYSNMDENTDVAILQTVQVSPIRHVFSALKEMITDLNIVIDKDKLKITNYDRGHAALVDVCLKFDTHICLPNKIIICANSLKLSKLISLATNQDVLRLHIPLAEYKDGNVGNLGIQYDNASIGQRSNYLMSLFTTDEEELVVPEIEYDSVMVITSVGFQKIIRDLNVCGMNRVRIESVGGEIKFTPIATPGPVPWVTSGITRRETANCVAADPGDAAGIYFKKRADPSHVFRGEFTSKCLTNLLKCTSMSTNVEIRMRNGYPLIVRYLIGADMGHFSVCISPLPPL